jgi:hypothetical protein
MVDPQDLKRSHSDSQVIEVRDEVGHELGRIAEQKCAQK